MLSRREFVLRTSSLVSLSPLVPGMLCRAARAASAQPDARALVVIQLDGGNDGLNTIVPYADDEYAKLRPKLRVDAQKVHKLDDHVGLHPAMSAAKELFDDGRLCVIQGVGYPNPNRSHFSSMRIWQTASLDEADHDSYGWLGRAMDRRLPATAPGEAPLLYVGEEQLPVALWARRAAANNLSRLEDLELRSASTRGVDDRTARGASDVSQFVTRQVLSAYASAEELARHRRAETLATVLNYPESQLATRLKVVAQLIKGGSQGRVFYTAQSGYDTHAAQEFTHANLLGEFSRALKAFLDDMRQSGLDERIVVLAFSEFGRRARENDSVGTDHGAAGPVFLAGSPLKGGLLGAAPNLTGLDAGDVTMSIDFRQVYATLLDEWLDVASAEVLGTTFGRLAALKS